MPQKRKAAVETRPSVKLVVGFAFQAKERYGEKGQKFPHRKYNAGEDALFITNVGDQTHFGVADGVSAWKTDYKVDSSEFSWALMSNAEAIVKADPSLEPFQVLIKSYDKTIENKALSGSSTACLARFDAKTANFCFTNLGDSGLKVIREKRVIAGTIPSSHFSNVPYQLTALSKEVEKRYPKLREYATFNLPNEAVSGQLNLKVGDLVIAGSDGLFDHGNSFQVKLDKLDLDKTLPELLEKSPKVLQARLTQMAELLIDDCCRGVSSDLDDDTTVIIACVTESATAKAKKNKK